MNLNYSCLHKNDSCFKSYFLFDKMILKLVSEFVKLNFLFTPHSLTNWQQISLYLFSLLDETLLPTHHRHKKALYVVKLTQIIIKTNLRHFTLLSREK